MNKMFYSDAIGTIAGFAPLGTSNVTSFIESIVELQQEEYRI